MAHVQRVFQYHGAEHKAINTLEAGLPITLDNARGASRIHPRCGTNFIFIVLITAIVVFSILPRHSFHRRPRPLAGDGGPASPAPAGGRGHRMRDLEVGRGATGTSPGRRR